MDQARIDQIKQRVEAIAPSSEDYNLKTACIPCNRKKWEDFYALV
jgi:5-methylcytosine-specific restriction endonuclease McrA